MKPEDADDYRGLGWAHGALDGAAARRHDGAGDLRAWPTAGRSRRCTSRPGPTTPDAAGLPGILAEAARRVALRAVRLFRAGRGLAGRLGEGDGRRRRADEEVHGHCSNHEWALAGDGDQSLRLALEYPLPSPVLRVERTVTPDPDAPAVDLEFRIVVRRRCRLPIGLHPVFRLPTEAGAAQLELGASIMASPIRAPWSLARRCFRQEPAVRQPRRRAGPRRRSVSMRRRAVRRRCRGAAADQRGWTAGGRSPIMPKAIGHG